MGIDLGDKKERYKYLSAAPVLANMYLLIKVHKNNFPGRAVVNQTDDPTYKICKILTDILNPLAIKSRSYIENSFELKKVLSSVSVDSKVIQATFDVRSLAQAFRFRRHCKLPEKDFTQTSLLKIEPNGTLMISLNS